MKKLKFLAVSILIILASCAPKEPEYYVCAYIWPSCHNDSLAQAKIWSDGRGEWEIIEKGTPRFEGHYQPRRPLWEGDMDDDPMVVEKWIKTALKYGVNTFVYDWYWFDHYPFLEEALNNGFLQAPSCEKMNFYIMYANHEVTNLWNPYENEEKKLLFDPRIDWNDWEKIVERVIRQYFHRPNYVKIDGCPIFSLWDLQLFQEGFGSLEEAGKAMDYFRAEVKKAGFPDLHLQDCGGIWRRSVSETAALKAQYKRYGVASKSAYNMGDFRPDYIEHGYNGLRNRDWWAETFDVPVFPTVSIAWDSTPRFLEQGKERVTVYNNPPTAFAMFLLKAKEYADAHAATQPKFVYINAWNEYVEGSYLLPDCRDGFSYLEAVKDVFDGKYDIK